MSSLLGAGGRRSESLALQGATNLAGVLGWPVAHSLSPRLHGYWLRYYGLDGVYVPLAVRPKDLAAALNGLVALGFQGANVTVPYKEMVAASIDALSATARRIGAVNTLIVDNDGCLKGDNTDAFGFIENLKAVGPPAALHDKATVVIGAGGAARAIVVALIDAGVREIRLVNRSNERALRLAEAIAGPISVLDWRERADALAGAALVVNATTLGMTGQPSLDLALDALPPDAIVNDIVYTPLRTPLLVAAEARGLRTLDGLGMLLHQARPGFLAWFGRDPEVTTELRRHVLAGLPT